MSAKDAILALRFKQWRTSVHKAMAEARKSWKGSPDDHIGLVAAKGKSFGPAGTLRFRHFCERHNINTEYSRQYDAYYCPSCNCWREPVCGNPDCEFCNQRPPTPEALT